MKKIKPYLIAMPAFVFILLFSIGSFCLTIILSFTYNKYLYVSDKNLIFSFQNYIDVLTDPKILVLFRNSFVLGFIPIITTVVLSYFLIMCISKFKYRWIKLLAITLLAIPMLVPASSFFAVFYKFNNAINNTEWILALINKQQIYIFGDPKIFPIVFILMSTIREVAIPVILGVLVCQIKGEFHKKGVFFTLLAYALIRFTTFLSPDLNLLFASYNPLLYETADVFDTYIFRTSIMAENLFHASTIKIIQSIVQIPISIGAIALLFKISKHIPRPAEYIKTDADRRISPVAIIGFILLSFGSIIFIVGLINPELFKTIIDEIFVANKVYYYNYSGRILALPLILSGFLNSLFYGLVSAIIFTVLSVTLAYPLLIKNKKYFVLLALVMVIPNSFSSLYIIYDKLGFIDTAVPIIITPLVTTMGAFAIYYSIQHKFNGEMPSFNLYLKEAKACAIIIAVLMYIKVYGDFLMSIWFLKSETNIGMGIYAHIFCAVENICDFYVPDGIQALTLLLSAIVPIVLGIVLIWASKKLPLSVFSVQSKK